ncbi:MAG: sialidase family protein [Pirellulaceae bacterium]
MLAYCEARKSDRGDWGSIDVLMRRSTDGGKTWGPRQKIVHVEGDLPINPLAAAQNLIDLVKHRHQPVAIVDPSNRGGSFSLPRIHAMFKMAAMTTRRGPSRLRSRKRSRTSVPTTIGKCWRPDRLTRFN